MNRRTRVLLWAVLLGLPIGGLLLPRSQEPVIRRWEPRTGPLYASRARALAVERMLRRAAPAGGRHPRDYMFVMRWPGRVLDLKIRAAGLDSLADLAGLESLGSLEYLDLSGNALRGTLDVGKFPRMRHLRLRGTRLDSIVGLRYLAGLVRLDLADAGFTRLGQMPGIESLASLQELDLSGNPLSGSLDVGSLRSLRQLRLARTRLDSIAGLGALERLTTLDVSDTRLRRLEPPPGLTSLDASRAPIEDLGPVGSLARLEALDLRGLDMGRVRGFERLRAPPLRDLDLGGCARVNAAMLARLGGLLHLTLDSAEVVGTGALRLPDSLAALSLRGARLEAGASFDTLRALRYLMAGPRDPVIPTARPPIVFESDQAVRGVVLSWLRRVGAFFFASLAIVLLSLLGAGLLPGPRLHLLRSTLRNVAAGTALLFLTLLVLALVQKADRPLPGAERTIETLAVLFAVAFLVLTPAVEALRTLPSWRRSRAWVWAPLATGALRIWLVIAALGLLAADISRRNSNPALQRMNSIVNVLIVVAMVFMPLWILSHGAWWEYARRRLRRFWTGRQATAPTVVIAGPLAGLQTGYSVWSPRDASSIGGPEVQLLGALGPGLLPSGVPVAEETRDRLAGVVVALPSGLMGRWPDWQVREVAAWLRRVHTETWAPVWVVGDWVGQVNHDSRRERWRRQLEPLRPWVDSYEMSRWVRTSTPFALSVPGWMSGCVDANRLVPAASLDREGMTALLTGAWTPVARLVRSLFVLPEVTDRLDVLVRSAESAVTFFALILAEEHEARDEGRRDERIERGLRRNLVPRPTFQNWVALLDTLARTDGSVLADRVDAALRRPAPADFEALAGHVRKLAGMERIESLRAEGEPTVRDALQLVLVLRNYMVARGPQTQKVGPEAYSGALTSCVGILSRLPWEALRIVGSPEEGKALLYCGTHPEPAMGGTRLAASQVVVALPGAADGEESVLDVSSRFVPVPGADSMAMWVAEDSYADPVSGFNSAAPGRRMA